MPRKGPVSKRSVLPDPKFGSHLMTKFINRLMHHDQQLKPIILKRSATSDKHATMGIAIITAGFIAALLGLLLIDSQAAAGLAGLIAMGAALTGGALLNQTKLDGGTATQTSSQISA